jgi:deoxyribonuclease-4
MFGSHLSTAGGMHNALLDARRLTMECVQVFTKNQRQWFSPPLDPAAVRDWQSHRKEIPLQSVISHDSYLINLASPSPELLGKSTALFREEIERCEALDIPYLVTHPGAHMGEGEAAGLKRIIESLDKVHAELRGYKTVTCLEITAGQGTTLGFKLEHLRDIIAGVAEPQRLGVCIDSAHSIEAGYDLTSAAGTKAFLKELDAVVGLDRVKVMHLNDSKTPRGSRVDRHENIGHGHIPLESFAVIVNHPKLRKVPKIMETPKEKHADGREWDEVNLQTLRGLVTQSKKRA